MHRNKAKKQSVEAIETKCKQSNLSKQTNKENIIKPAKTYTNSSSLMH